MVQLERWSVYGVRALRHWYYRDHLLGPKYSDRYREWSIHEGSRLERFYCIDINIYILYNIHTRTIYIYIYPPVRLALVNIRWRRSGPQVAPPVKCGILRSIAISNINNIE